MQNIAFVFPGQGAQYVGMAKDIAMEYKKSDNIFEEASDTLGNDVKKMIFEGDEETLKITENTQPAILAASIACMQPLLQEGIIPDVFVKNTIEPVNRDELYEFNYKTKPTLGDAGDVVMAAKQRLNLLGYDIDLSNDILDEMTFEAIKDFQAYNNLFPYGTLDFITKVMLDQAIEGMQVVKDKQMDKALELLNHIYSDNSIE